MPSIARLPHRVHGLVAVLGLSCAVVGAASQGTPPEGFDPLARYSSEFRAKAAEVGVVLDPDKPPRPVATPRPHYPDEAFKQCLEGRVTIGFIIDVDGHVLNPEVVESVPELDAAALECVKKWRFDPAREGGRAVPCVAEVPISFRIMGKTRPAQCR